MPMDDDGRQRRQDRGARRRFLRQVGRSALGAGLVLRNVGVPRAMRAGSAPWRVSLTGRIRRRGGRVDRHFPEPAGAGVAAQRRAVDRRPAVRSHRRSSVARQAPARRVGRQPCGPHLSRPVDRSRQDSSCAAGDCRLRRGISHHFESHTREGRAVPSPSRTAAESRGPDPGVRRLMTGLDIRAVRSRRTTAPDHRPYARAPSAGGLIASTVSSHPA